MTVIPVQALDSRDCATPGCPDAAEYGSDVCRAHKQVTHKLDIRSIRSCKIDGCTEPANTRYDRGIYALLCEAHIEERRARGVAPTAPRRGPQFATSEGFEQKARSLVKAGRRLDQAIGRYRVESEKLDAKKHALDVQVESLRGALDGAMREWREQCHALAHQGQAE